MASKQRKMWIVHKNHKNSSFVSHAHCAALCTCPRGDSTGLSGSQASARQDLHGMFPCLLIRAENPEIEHLYVIIQQMSSIDGNYESVSNKWFLDCRFFSSAALISKLFSSSRSKLSGQDDWGFQNCDLQKKLVCPFSIQSVIPLYLTPEGQHSRPPINFFFTLPHLRSDKFISHMLWNPKLFHLSFF